MSSAGRCIALSTSSGTVVGPGMLRNSRPLRRTIARILLDRAGQAGVRGVAILSPCGKPRQPDLPQGWAASAAARRLEIEDVCGAEDVAEGIGMRHRHVDAEGEGILGIEPEAHTGGER